MPKKLETPITVVQRLPKASSLTQTHIIMAVVYKSRHQQQRIEEFGRLNRRILRGIGKPAREDGTVGKTPGQRAEDKRGPKSRHRR
jgi:hypothetical protein